MRYAATTSRATGVVLLALAINPFNPVWAQACAGWNLSTELRVAPQQANPNPDKCGNANVWYFMESSSLARDPTTYSLLPEFIPDAFFISGLQQWQDLSECSTSCNDKLPAIGVNTTGMFQQPGSVAWPAGVVRLHPAPNRLAFVAWRSPTNGSVTVSGAFADIDPNCEGGVAWFVEQGTTTLAEGSFPSGG